MGLWPNWDYGHHHSSVLALNKANPVIELILEIEVGGRHPGATEQFWELISII